MKEYSKDELMIEIRKAAEKQRPEPGELVQGIVFAALTALEHLKGAEVLLENKMVISGYGSLISAMEELGKINRLADILVSWQAPDKAEEFKSRQKSHPWKLSGALEIFSKLVSNPETTISVSGVVKDWLNGGDPVEFMLKFVNPEAAENYHDLRLKTSYTNFDGQRVSSPYQNLDRIEPELLKMIVTILKVTLEKVLLLGDKVLPIYMDLIRKCYLETGPQKITSLKTEINRRVWRTMPAIRKYMDLMCIEQTGHGVDYWAEKSQEENNQIIAKAGDIAEHVKAVAKVIVGSEEIEEIYFYPPLKESAKEFYTSFIEPQSPS